MRRLVKKFLQELCKTLYQTGTKCGGEQVLQSGDLRLVSADNQEPLIALVSKQQCVHEMVMADCTNFNPQCMYLLGSKVLKSPEISN